MEGYFSCQGEAKSLECGSFVHFLDSLEDQEMSLFLEMRLSLQRLKSLFVHLFWLETKMSIVDGPMTLVHFMDWAGS